MEVMLFLLPHGSGAELRSSGWRQVPLPTEPPYRSLFFLGKRFLLNIIFHRMGKWAKDVSTLRTQALQSVFLCWNDSFRKCLWAEERIGSYSVCHVSMWNLVQIPSNRVPVSHGALHLQLQSQELRTVQQKWQTPSSLRNPDWKQVRGGARDLWF